MSSHCYDNLFWEPIVPSDLNLFPVVPCLTGSLDQYKVCAGFIKCSVSLRFKARVALYSQSWLMNLEHLLCCVSKFRVWSQWPMSFRTHFLFQKTRIWLLLFLLKVKSWLPLSYCCFDLSKIVSAGEERWCKRLSNKKKGKKLRRSETVSCSIHYTGEDHVEGF